MIVAIPEILHIYMTLYGLAMLYLYIDHIHSPQTYTQTNTQRHTHTETHTQYIWQQLKIEFMNLREQVAIYRKDYKEEMEGKRNGIIRF